LYVCDMYYTVYIIHSCIPNSFLMVYRTRNHGNLVQFKIKKRKLLLKLRIKNMTYKFSKGKNIYTYIL